MTAELSALPELVRRGLAIVARCSREGRTADSDEAVTIRSAVNLLEDALLQGQRAANVTALLAELKALKR